MGPLLLAVALLPKAVADAELVRQAEALFSAGTAVRDNPDHAQPLFHRAASCYEELRQRGAHNPELYRNQGNAFLLAGDLPRAILAYRRGLRLAPGDPSLWANLTYARTQVARPGPKDLGRPNEASVPLWLPRLSLHQQLLFFFCTYSLGWLGIIRWCMLRRTAALAVGVMGFSLATLLAGSLTLALWSERHESLHSLVVIAQDRIPLRKGNGVLYPPHWETPLHRGVEARLQFERGDWLQIELAGGQTGWVPRAAVLLDAP
jgi:tetratricopeptide (TPR) repeat protein